MKVEVYDIKFYLAFACSGFSFSNLERNSYPFMHKALIYSAVNDTSPCVREHIFSKQNYTSDAFGCLEITTVTDSPRLCLLAFFSLSVILFIYLNNCLFILFWVCFFLHIQRSAQHSSRDLSCRAAPLVGVRLAAGAFH